LPLAKLAEVTFVPGSVSRRECRREALRRQRQSLEDQSSGNDLQECDFAPLQAEEEPEINWAARKVSRQPACDDRLAVLLLHGEGFTGVGVSGRGFCLPSLDGGQTGVGMTFIFHNGVRRKPPRDSLAVELIGGEVGGDRFGKVDAV